MVLTVTPNFTCVRIIHIPWALFWISFYSSPVCFIWHFCPGRLPCVIPGIFSQCLLYEKLFSTGSCKKKKKKCKTVSLKPSVVHLDLHTVGGTWGLVCCCLKKDVPFTNENTATWQDIERFKWRLSTCIFIMKRLHDISSSQAVLLGWPYSVYLRVKLQFLAPPELLCW